MKNVTPTARSIVDQLFGRDMIREIWTGNYDKVLPLSIQDFDLTAVLPAVEPAVVQILLHPLEGSVLR